MITNSNPTQQAERCRTLAIDEKKKAMSEIIEYRPINEDERIEIDQLAAKGLVLIGLQESAESSAILDGIKNYLNNFQMTRKLRIGLMS